MQTYVFFRENVSVIDITQALANFKFRGILTTTTFRIVFFPDVITN